MKASILCSFLAMAVLLQARDFVPEARNGAAIQKAIDAAFASGGGRVALERGVVLSAAEREPQLRQTNPMDGNEDSKIYY